MLRLLILAALAALVFYAALPLAGAFGARARWRAFRRRLADAAGYPLLSFGNSLHPSETAPAGFQHYGSVEAIEGNDSVWVRGTTLTAAVSLENARIYILPAARAPTKEGEYDLESADESLMQTSWKNLSGLEESARVYAAGNLGIEGGLPIFRGTAKDPLLVLFYDGRDEDLLKRAIWAGRHRNEYWNPVTLASLTAGFLSTGTALYELLRPPLLSLPAAIVTALAFTPILPFLPPGLAFLAAYRRLWTKARRLRARRDLLRFGLTKEDSFKSSFRPLKASVEACVRQARFNEIFAGLLFSAAMLVNYIGVVFVVRAIIR